MIVRPLRRAERGFSLIVSLMMLIVIIILGVSAAQIAINETRGARSDRDRQIAFQAAEAALKDAEFEILDPSMPACAQKPPANVGRGRGPLSGTSYVCFNATSQFGFTGSATSPCSLPPNEGLCLYDQVNPAYRRPSTMNHIDFLADAKGSGDGSTVQYGKFTGKTFAARSTSTALSTQPLSAYPPRYIIERVPRNTSVDTITDTYKGMFRVTAIGFGANENTQVVLQTVVATQD